MSDLPKFRITPVAAAVWAALYGATTAHAQTQPQPERELSKIEVQDEESAYRVEQSSSPKYTQPLLDTPQNIQVVPRKLIEEQSLLSLRDILATVPGITFGAGEGGGGYGDSLTLRGFSGSNDISVDGIRDSAQYTRSDPFNLEQVEVVSGASSVYSGSGSVGGTVNLVSKSPQLRDFTRFELAGGTDSYARGTADGNWQLGAGSAVRVNAMAHRNDIPGRNVEKAERWGVAPTVAFGLDGATAFTFSFVHQHDDNTPQYGVPTFNGAALPGVDPEAYYGYSNIDEQKIDADIFTALVNHSFNERVVLRNQTRWGQVDQVSIVDPPQGTFCLPNNRQPTGVACPVAGGGLPALAPGFYRPSGPRGNVRDTTNRIMINQTDVTTTFRTGAIEHAVVTGLSFSHETYDLTGGNVLRATNGALPNPVLPDTPIGAPNPVYAGPYNFVRAQTIEGDLDNRAIYAFDTLKFAEHWQIDGGLRLERNEGGSTTINYNTLATGGAIASTLPGENSDSLISYRGAVTYKPVANGSIYLSYGNSQTPSRASVNGSCTAVSTATAGANCNVDPEKGETVELGAKWDLFESRLSLTGSLSRNERSNYRVNDLGNPENPSGFQVLDGSARVDALIVGIAGRVTDNWAVYANYSRLDSEVLQGVSDRQVGQGLDFIKGDPLQNVPENAASLWTTWDVMRGVQLGYGVTYQGRVTLTQHSAANVAGPLVEGAGYLVHRATASYKFNRNFELRLNANNIFDKEYLIRQRTQQIAWATPGEARNFVLTGVLSF